MKDIDFSALYNKSCDVDTSGTDNWLLSDPKYKDWRDRRGGVL
jgi:hypothetical protein